MNNPTYRETVSYNNLRTAAKACTNNVRWKPSVQMFEVNSLQWTAELHKQLLDHSYKSKGFYKFWLMERGKMRYIRSVHISERCVQKAINNYGVKPVVEPRLIYDNSASLKGKGTDFAIKRLRKQLATHYRKYRKQGGILTIDLHDYFNSIPHDKLFDALKFIIKDDELYYLTKYFIDCFGDKGLGLGSELSQISAILYPNKLDHYIKEQLHIKGYGRYMDDSYLIHHDIEYLRKCKRLIENKVKEMGLELNPKSKITPFDKGSFVYLKRRFSISDTGKIVTRLKRSNITKRRRLLKKQKKKLDNGLADIKSIRQSYQSWRGYAAKWDSHKTVKNMDNLYKQLFNEEGDPYVMRKRRNTDKTVRNDPKHGRIKQKNT